MYARLLIISFCGRTAISIYSFWFFVLFFVIWNWLVRACVCVYACVQCSMQQCVGTRRRICEIHRIRLVAFLYASERTCLTSARETHLRTALQSHTIKPLTQNAAASVPKTKQAKIERATNHQIARRCCMMPPHYKQFGVRASTFWCARWERCTEKGAGRRGAAGGERTPCTFSRSIHFESTTEKWLNTFRKKESRAITKRRQRKIGSCWMGRMDEKNDARVSWTHRKSTNSNVKETKIVDKYGCVLRLHVLNVTGGDSQHTHREFVACGTHNEQRES